MFTAYLKKTAKIAILVLGLQQGRCAAHKQSVKSGGNEADALGNRIDAMSLSDVKQEDRSYDRSYDESLVKAWALEGRFLEGSGSAIDNLGNHLDHRGRNVRDDASGRAKGYYYADDRHQSFESKSSAPSYSQSTWRHTPSNSFPDAPPAYESLYPWAACNGFTVPNPAGPCSDTSVEPAKVDSFPDSLPAKVDTLPAKVDFVEIHSKPRLYAPFIHLAAIFVLVKLGLEELPWREFTLASLKDNAFISFSLLMLVMSIAGVIIPFLGTIYKTLLPGYVTAAVLDSWYILFIFLSKFFKTLQAMPVDENFVESVKKSLNMVWIDSETSPIPMQAVKALEFIQNFGREYSLVLWAGVPLCTLGALAIAWFLSRGAYYARCKLIQTPLVVGMALFYANLITNYAFNFLRSSYSWIFTMFGTGKEAGAAAPVAQKYASMLFSERFVESVFASTSPVAAVKGWAGTILKSLFSESFLETLNQLFVQLPWFAFFIFVLYGVHKLYQAIVSWRGEEDRFEFRVVRSDEVKIN